MPSFLHANTASPGADLSPRRRGASQARAARSSLALGLLLLSAALSSSPVAVDAQDRAIRFRHLGPQDGLNQGTIYTLHQDRIGFLWAGTGDGLHRFDGESFEVFRHDPMDPATLPHDRITALAEDDHAGLWIGTWLGGLARLDLDTGTIERRTSSSSRVRRLAVTPDGAVWVATADRGLERHDPASGTVRRFVKDPDDPRSLAGNRLLALHVGRSGDLFVGTSRGVDRYDPTSEDFDHFTWPGSEEEVDVRSLLEDRRGVLWAGTAKGLVRIEPTTGETERFAADDTDSDALAHGFVQTLLEDADGRLWIGTDGGLCLHHPPSRFTCYRNEAGDPWSLADDRVLSLYQDRGGVLWVGTQQGLDRWDPRTWSFSHHRGGTPGGLRGQNVMAFAEDDAGDLWIGSLDAGVERLDRRSGTFHRPPGGVPEERVTSLLHRRDGLWIGTMSGLVRFEPGSDPPRSERFPADARPGALPAPGVVTLFEDRRGDLWVGTWGGGLARYEPGGTFESFHPEAGDVPNPGSDRVIALEQTSAEALWVGTDGAGVERLDLATGRFLRLEWRDALASPGRNSIQDLHVDADQTLWIGTQGAGLDRLLRFDPRTGEAEVSNYSEAHGLPNKYVWGIESDDRGRLWISTNRGLARFDPRTESFVSFDTSHGLQADEFNLGAHYESASGELFFGGVAGFNAFYPYRLERNDTPPPVVFTDLEIGGRPAVLDRPTHRLDRLVLGPGDDMISLEIAALDFAAPEKNRVSYQLVGFQDEPQDLGTRRRVTFTNLDPGEYVLRATAANKDGTWNREGASLPIRVEPPAWRSTEARFLYVLTLALVVVAFLRHQRERERQRDDLRRAKEAAEAASRAKGHFLATMSHEIRTPLNGVVGMASLLLETPTEPRQRRYLESIRVASESLVAVVNDILDFSKIESEHLELENAPFDLRATVEEALEVATPAAVHKGLDLAYWIEEGTPERLVGDAARLRQVLVNLLSNGVKFTEQGEVTITVCARPADLDAVALRFSVADSGIGIAPDRIDHVLEPFTQAEASTTRRYGGTGLGLAICRRLVEAMGGELGARSRPSEGSVFFFTARFEVGEEAFAHPELYRADPRLDGRRLLLVEANGTLARLLARRTALWGLMPSMAGSTAEVLERLETDAIDIALVDPRVPAADGEAWFEELGRRFAEHGVAVITTPPLGLADPSGLRERLGAMASIPRPVRPLDCLGALRRAAREGRRAPRRHRPPPTTTATAPPRDLDVLVVDDNAMNRDVMLRLLEHLGHRAEAVCNGLEAVEHLLARAARPGDDGVDIVLMDLEMPVLDGYGAVTRIRCELPAGRQPAIVAVTAHAMLGVRERCLEAGMDDYLSKPVQIELLRTVLQRTTERNTEQRAARHRAPTREWAHARR